MCDWRTGVQFLVRAEIADTSLLLPDQLWGAKLVF